MTDPIEEKKNYKFANDLFEELQHNLSIVVTGWKKKIYCHIRITLPFYDFIFIKSKKKNIIIIKWVDGIKVKFD